MGVFEEKFFEITSVKSHSDMRTVIVLLLGLLFLSSCSSDRRKVQKAIGELEKQVEATPDQVQAHQLIREYKLYPIKFPQDKEMNSRYLYRAAALQLRLDRPSEAAETLNLALEKYWDTSNSLNSASLLAAIYQEQLEDTASATTIYQLLRDVFPGEESVREKHEALTPPPAPLEKRLEDMRNAVFANATGTYNTAAALYFIHSCELQALMKPADMNSAKWLNQAAETARAIKNNPKALLLYEWIYTKFPGYDKAPQALFLKGFILDEEMGRKEEARAVYERFIQQYPNDDFADDAQFLLDNLDKDEGEIIRQFEQQQ